MTLSDNTAEDLLLVWRLARMVTTSDNPGGTEARLPGFSAFCADFHPHRQGSIIGYLPLIPASPTDLAVLEEDGKPVPIPSTQPAWPASMNKTISCGCVKGCQKNCSCVKKAIHCYIGCRCQGLATECSRTQYTTTLESDSSSEPEKD